MPVGSIGGNREGEPSVRDAGTRRGLGGDRAAYTAGPEPEAGVQRLKSWNLHLFARIPPGQILGSDVIFVEPPVAGGAGGA